jgi:hypothetical protein
LKTKKKEVEIINEQNASRKNIWVFSCLKKKKKKNFLLLVEMKRKRREMKRGEIRNDESEGN